MVGGSALNLANGEIIEHDRVLDMRHGVVFRTWRQRLRGGRTVRVRTARFASLADRQFMAARAEATPEDVAGSLVWQSAIGVTHAGGPTSETEFEVLEDPPGLIARTRGRNGGGHVLAVTTNPAPGSPVARTPQQARDVIGGRLEAGDPATVDRLAAIVSARTRAPSADIARRALARAAETRVRRAAAARPGAAWDAAWRDADVRIDGDADDQHALRFSIYHIISTAHPDQRHRLDRRSRPRRHVLLPARVLGHRDLPPAVLHPLAAADGAHAARLPLPQPSAARVRRRA